MYGSTTVGLFSHAINLNLCLDSSQRVESGFGQFNTWQALEIYGTAQAHAPSLSNSHRQGCLWSWRLMLNDAEETENPLEEGIQTEAATANV